METFLNLERVFVEILNNLDCNELTRAYILSILLKYHSTQFDYSKDTITLLFQKSSEKRDFFTFQNIGDWVFFSQSVFPEQYQSYGNYVENLARLSYDRCYKLIDRKWPVYQNLADEFPRLTKQTNKLIREI